MSSSRKTTFVYYERKVRDENEIQSLLLEDDDDDDEDVGKDEEEPSNDRWVVQKSSKSPSRDYVVRLSRCDVDTSTSPGKTKEKSKASPLTIKRKLSYAVNKVETPKRRPDIVSPILIKRIPDSDLSTNVSSPVSYNKLHTIDLLTSEEDDEISKKLESKKTKNGRKSGTKKELSTKESKTSQSKKMVKLKSDSDDNDFELTTPSKSRKSHRKTKIVSEDDDDDDWLIKEKVAKLERKTPRRKTQVEPPEEDDEEIEIQTPSKTIQKRLSDGKTSDTEETKMDCTPSKRRKKQIIPKNVFDETPSDMELALPLSSRIRQNKTDSNEVASDVGLPLSSRVRQNLQNKENVLFKTPEKSFESKLSRVFSALDKISFDSLSDSPLSKDSKNSVVGSAKQMKRTSTRQTPSKSEVLKSAVAMSKADMTPNEGTTPGKGTKVSSSMTPTKGTMPSKSPAKPSQVVTLSEDEIEPAKPSRTSRARKVVTSSEDEDELATPSRTSRAKKVVNSSEDDYEPAKPSRTSSRARKVVTSSEDEDEPATPSRTSRARKSNRRFVSPKDSSTRPSRHRDQINETQRHTAGIPAPHSNARTPRRSTRISMSPSTPSLRQKVLMAITPRSSLPPVKDEDESKDEFVTPHKTPKSAKKKLDMTPTTPSSCKKVGHGFLSPVVADREGRGPVTPSSALGIARAQLQVSTLPTSLPCREKEFNDIKSFITRKIQDGTGGCMYISGVPGTGKTATVHTVVRTLQKMAEDCEMPRFDFVEVNGLRMTEPRQAYVRIWQILSKNKVTADQALKHLETKFLGKPKRCTVLLVDELDYLCNRRQDVIYNILDWTTKRYSKFIVLTIANTMDLPERTLKGKVTSRMGLTRVVFQPYTYQQLEEIVLNRLDGCKAFHADAVQLVARKVAAVSGDARRALDICRRSTEILELEGRSAVSVLDIQKVLTQIFAGSRVQAIKNCSLMAKLVLRAIRDEVLRTGVEETTVAYLHPQLVSICALEGKREPSVTVILTICTNLADSGLIFAEKGRKDINRKISLNISTDDIHYAIDC